MNDTATTTDLNVRSLPSRDKYGRRCEKRYLSRDPHREVVMVVTLPFQADRKATGKPTHLANDWGRKDESAVYFHSLKDARAWADARLRSR